MTAEHLSEMPEALRPLCVNCDRARADVVEAGVPLCEECYTLAAGVEPWFMQPVVIVAALLVLVLVLVAISAVFW